MHNVGVRRVVLLSLALVALVSACGRDSSGLSAQQVLDASSGLVRIEPQDRVPMVDLAGSTLDGGTSSTGEHLGKVVVINAWATWCPPCRDEIPLLVDAAKASDPESVAFLGLNVNDDAEAARDFSGLNGIPYSSIVDADGALMATIPTLPSQGLPTTVFVDRQGRVAARIAGAVKPGQVEDVIAALEAEE